MKNIVSSHYQISGGDTWLSWQVTLRPSLYPSFIVLFFTYLIYIPNANGCFPFDIDFFLSSVSLSLTRLLSILTMSNMVDFLWETGSACFSQAPEFIHGFLVGSVLFTFLVFCVVIFAMFGVEFCVLWHMFPVSLDCPFLIAPSAFSNVYLMSLDCPFSFLLTFT